MRSPSLVGLALVLLAGHPSAPAASPPETVSIAAASNFVHALDALHAEYRRSEPGIVVRTSNASSGSLFAQIRNGAPFDVFLSADTDYPRQLVTVGAGDAGSLRTFAAGRLAIWTTRTQLDLTDLAALVRDPTVRRIAIAQPATAPYGRAAQAVMTQLGVWPQAQPKLVLGETIAQALQFVETGNADFGLVALSLIRTPRLAGLGHWREIPPAAFPGVSLDHAAVLTNRGTHNPAAQRYLAFLQSPAARKILTDFGSLPIPAP